MAKYEQERIPFQLLKEGEIETRGKDARKNSFAAVKFIMIDEVYFFRNQNKKTLGFVTER